MAEYRWEGTMAAKWSSIHSDFVRSISDLLSASATTDADVRAVCNNLSADIAKPPPLGLGSDYRLVERQWVMLDEKKPTDGIDGRLFFNASTGRFLRLHLPLLDGGDYILVGASDGLLVLGDKKGLNPARLLNPFIGDLIPFAAPVPQECKVLTAVAGSSSSPTILCSFEDMCHKDHIDVVYCADATSPLSEVQFDFEERKDDEFVLRSLLSYAGHFYMVDYYGGIFKVVGTAPRYHGELIANAFDIADHVYFLVESAGDLLLVSRGNTTASQNLVEVFRVDTEQKVLEPVNNIGSSALFLGVRCLSVDADRLPSVDRNCVYYVDEPACNRYGCDSVNRYDLRNNMVERFSCVFDDREAIRPFSMVQTLLDYCEGVDIPDIKYQVDRLQK